MIKNLIEYILKNLVEQPEKVNVQVFRGPKNSLEVRVAPDDFKRVIGKEGRIIKAIRSLVQALEPGDKEMIVDIVQE
jgi:uncharacterized protein